MKAQWSLIQFTLLKRASGVQRGQRGSTNERWPLCSGTMQGTFWLVLSPPTIPPLSVSQKRHSYVSFLCWHQHILCVCNCNVAVATVTPMLEEWQQWIIFFGVDYISVFTYFLRCFKNQLSALFLSYAKSSSEAVQWMRPYVCLLTFELHLYQP